MSALFLKLQSTSVFGVEITLPGRNAALPGSPSKLLPSLEGRKLSWVRGALRLSEPAPVLSPWALSLHLLPHSCICCLFLVLSAG